MPEALEAVIEAVSAPLFLYQPDQILYANRAAAALVGSPVAELVGMHFDDLFDSTSEAGVSAALLKARTGTIAVSLTNEEIQFEGKQYRLITALRCEPPEPELPDSQRLFETIFENTVVGIAIINEGAYYLRVNRTYADIYGYAPEEMMGQHLFLIFPPEIQPRAQETHDRFIRGEIPSSARSDWTVKRKDGQIIEISAFNNRMISETGERLRIVAVIDITEQKRTQQALQVSETRLNSLLNSMGDAVWSVWADTHRLFYVNPAIEALTGYSVDEFMTTDGLLFEIVHPEDREYFLDQMRKTLNGHRIDIDHRIIRRDGAVRWVHKRFWSVQRADGERIGGLMSDITDRKLAVEQAMQLKLENERVRILSGFIRDASHEFRTPLTVINTRLELLQRNTDPLRQSQYMDGIREQTTRILRLVETLITMSRLDEMTTLHLLRFDLNRSLRELHASHEKAAQRRRIVISLQQAAEPLYIQAGREALFTALHAICENAVHFTPVGGRIVLRSYRLNKREYAVEIADTGIGISEADLPRIFERFYRVDQAHSTEGFGLGLPLARRIMELHQGRIEVESSLGRGSLFRLVFPADRQD